MAILELGIQLNGLGAASNGLQNLQNQLNGLSRSNGVNINLPNTTPQINAASDSILGLRSRLNELLQTYGRLSEAQRSNSRVQNNLVPEINRLREAVNQANVEYNNLRRGTGRPIPSDSIVGMRQRLNELRRTYDNLSESQRNSARVQNNLVGEITRLNRVISVAEQSTGRYQRNVGNYSSALGNANGVTMEFNRIIQDAPFGMMGIGNNIQQLAANWQVYTTQTRAAAAANGQTIGTMGLLKGVVSNFLTTGNLLTFGIAAITSAWTAYSMNVKTAKEQTKDMNNQFTTQLGHLQNVISLTEKSAKTERDKSTAVSEYNKNLGDTLGKVKSYGELEQNLIKNGANYVKYLTLKSQSEATYQLALKNTATMMENVMTLESKGRSTGFGGWILKAGDTIDELVYGEGSKGKTKITSQDALRIAQLPTDKEFYIAIRGMGDGLKRGLKDVRADWKKTLQAGNLGSDLTQQFNKAADQMNLKMPDLNLDKDGKGTKALKEQFDYLQKIRDLLADKKQELDTFGLKGQAKELQELKNKYFDFYNELDKLENKASKDKNAPKGTIGAIQEARGVGSDLENKQRAEIISKWNEIYVQLTSEGLTKAGLISENARQKELSGWSKYVADLKVKMSEASTDMNAVNEFTSDLLRNGTRMIELKFSIEDVEGIKKDAEKIAEDLNKPFTAKNPASLQSQIDERIRIFKDATIKLAEAMKLAGFNVDMKQVNGYINEQSIKIQKQGESDYGKRIAIDFKNKLVDEFNTSFKSLFTNLQSNVDELGLSFSSVFYSLGATLQSSINNVNTDSINNIFEKFKTSGWEAVSGIDKAVAGLSTAGNLIQSIVSQSSGVGQGIGGALSGAGAGLGIGSMLTETLGKNAGIWGAAIGGVVGLVSGIFGGKKKRKEEERQRQQLEEQKKTNALLERMNALAYTSSIIGGKTTDGIVTGVNRNEFGQITVRVEGKDLVTVLGRQNAIGSR